MKPTEFDTAQARFFLECPSSISDLGDWENVYLCAKCDGLLDKDSPYMFTTEDGKNYGFDKSMNQHRDIPIGKVCCPHCSVNRLKDYYPIRRGAANSKPIEAKLIRRRKIYTSKEPSWWNRTFHGAKRQFFYEYHTEEITI